MGEFNIKKFSQEYVTKNNSPKSLRKFVNLFKPGEVAASEGGGMAGLADESVGIYFICFNVLRFKNLF